MIELMGLFSVILIFFAGFLVIQMIGVKDYSFLEQIGYALPIGMGATAYELVLFSRFKIPWIPEIVLLPWVLLCLYLLLKKKFYFRLGRPRLIKSQMLLLLLCLCLFMFVIIESQLRPLITWDGWATWVFRGNIFYIDGKIDPNILVFFNLDYPIWLSISVSLIYIILGEVNDRVVLLLYPAVYLSIFLTFFFALKKRIGITLGLLFSFLLLSSQILIRHAGRFDAGQADLPLALFFLGSSVSLLDFIRTKNYKYLVILFLLSGIGTQIKDEGLPFAIITGAMATFYILKERLYKYLFFNLLWFYPALDWIIYKNLNNFPASFHFTKGITFHFLERWHVIILGTVREFFSLRHWSLSWIAFFSSIVYLLVAKKFNPEIKILLLLVASQATFYFLIFVITPHNLLTYIPNVIDRLYLHLLPIASLVVGISFWEIVLKENSTNRSD